MERLNQEICLSMGGIQEIEIAFASSPDIFYPITFIENSATYKKVRRRNKNGTIFQHDCNFSILKNLENADLQTWLDENADNFFVIRITDQNSVEYVMGNTDYSAQLLEEINPGRQAQDENEVSFKFDCQTIN